MWLAHEEIQQGGEQRVGHGQLRRMATIEAHALGTRHQLLHALLHPWQHRAVLRGFDIQPRQTTETRGRPLCGDIAAAVGLHRQAARGSDRGLCRCIVKEQGAGGIARYAAAAGGGFEIGADAADLGKVAGELGAEFAEAHAAGQHHAGDIGDPGDALGVTFGHGSGGDAAAGMRDQMDRAGQRLDQRADVFDVALQRDLGERRGVAAVARQIDRMRSVAGIAQAILQRIPDPATGPGPVDEDDVSHRSSGTSRGGVLPPSPRGSAAPRRARGRSAGTRPHGPGCR